LIFHHIDKSDIRLEFIDLFAGRLLPVVAPDFLPFPISDELRVEQMRDYVQCIVRDTARHGAGRDYYLVEGARTCTVSDQMLSVWTQQFGRPKLTSPPSLTNRLRIQLIGKTSIQLSPQNALDEDVGVPPL
jgi:hypothetical protein